MKPAVFRKDKSHAELRGLFGEQLLGRAVDDNDVNEDANELLHRRVVVDRIPEGGFGRCGASHFSQRFGLSGQIRNCEQQVSRLAGNVPLNKGSLMGSACVDE
jgi:hypothetical protein